MIVAWGAIRRRPARWLIAVASALALVILTVAALVDLWPEALAAGYGRVSVLCALLLPILAWKSCPLSGAEDLPRAVSWSLGGLAALAAAAGAQGQWIAPPLLLSIGLCVIARYANGAWRPDWLLLTFVIPFDYVLDVALGDFTRTTTAQWSGGLASYWAADSAWSHAQALSCGIHTLYVTPACSGARNIVSMAVLTLGFACWARLSLRRTGLLVISGLSMIVAANVSRIAGLCVIATRESLVDAESWHGGLGAATFAAAYALSAVLAFRLRGAANSSNDNRRAGCGQEVAECDETR